MAIHRDPSIVLPASALRLQPIHPSAGAEPAGTASSQPPAGGPAVYPRDRSLEERWPQGRRAERVRALLAAAQSGSDPRPTDDDDGVSLQYVFGFLKAHRDLLRTAARAGLGVAYAEMSARA